LFIFSFTCICFSSSAQYWQKFYKGNTPLNCSDAIENYDKGFYIIGASYTAPSTLYKTDINGNILWQRSIGKQGDTTDIGAICATQDGGILILGNRYRSNWASNLYLLKINACGEKEWSRIYTANVNSGGICGVKQYKNGDYVFYCDYGGTVKDYMGVVYCSNAKGSLKWQYYSPIDNNDMYIDSLSNVILTGHAYFRKIDDTSHYDFVYALAKLDTSGKQDFFTQYNINKKIYGYAFSTMPSKERGYLTIGSRSVGGLEYVSSLLKCDSNGNPQWETILTDSATASEESPHSLSKINDSTFFISATTNLETSNVYQLKFIKITDKGEVLKQVPYQTSTYSLNDYRTHRTSDGKFLISGTALNLATGTTSMFVLKVNSDLGIDSFYPGHYVYDSLCSSSVAKTGNILIDSPDTIYITVPKRTGIAAQPENQPVFSLFPNPAKDHILLSASGLGQQRINGTVYDALGNKITEFHALPDPSGQMTQTIDLTKLSKGMYFISIGQGTNQYLQKFVVE